MYIMYRALSFALYLQQVGDVALIPRPLPPARGFSNYLEPAEALAPPTSGMSTTSLLLKHVIERNYIHAVLSFRFEDVENKLMGIVGKSTRNLKHSPRRGQHEYDCTSEPYTKPSMSDKMVNKIKSSLALKETFLQKQNVTLDPYKHIIKDLVTHLDRVTKVMVNPQACCVIDDLSLEECGVFIVKWSEELNNLWSEYRSHIEKISNVERLRRSLDICLNTREDQIQKVQKVFQWYIQILKSLPKSSVCQDRCTKIELLNLYRKWKKGELISMLPIMDLIMKTLLKEKDSILRWKLQPGFPQGLKKP